MLALSMTKCLLAIRGLLAIHSFQRFCLPSVQGAGETCFFIQCITYTHRFLNVNEFRLHDWAVDVTCDILVSVHKRLTDGC